MQWPRSTSGIKTIVIFFSFVFLFVVAVLLDLQYLYLMAVTIAVLPLASYALASFAATRFVAQRDHAPTATEDRPVTVTLHVSSRGGLPQGAVRVKDQLPDELSPLGAKETERTALDDWNGTSGDRTYQIVPQKRGIYRIGPTTIHTTDPLGLFNFSASVALETELVVHPLPVLSSSRAVGGEGRFGRRERAGQTHRGEGIDFHGVREYRTGDSLRRVHWPTTARTGKLTVIEFERALQQDAVVALDRSRDMERGTGRHTTLEYAIKIAASLVERSLVEGGSVTFVTQGTVLKIGPGIDAQAARFRIFDALARVTADAETSLADDLVAARLGDGSYVALISAQGDPAVSAYLFSRLQHGDQVGVYFVEPTSFGRTSSGGSVMSPAVAGAALCLITQDDDPWKEGGRALAQRLHEVT